MRGAMPACDRWAAEAAKAPQAAPSRATCHCMPNPYPPTQPHLRRRHGMDEVHRALRKGQQQRAAPPVLCQASQDGGQRCIVLVSLLPCPSLERIRRQLRAAWWGEAGGVEELSDGEAPQPSSMPTRASRKLCCPINPRASPTPPSSQPVQRLETLAAQAAHLSGTSTSKS